jgi:hypothetical protein
VPRAPRWSATCPRSSCTATNCCVVTYLAADRLDLDLRELAAGHDREDQPRGRRRLAGAGYHRSFGKDFNQAERAVVLLSEQPLVARRE